MEGRPERKYAASVQSPGKRCPRKTITEPEVKQLDLMASTRLWPLVRREGGGGGGDLRRNVEGTGGVEGLTRGVRRTEAGNVSSQKLEKSSD